MTNPPDYRLIILSGPSCAGKSPLAKALKRFYPELDKKMAPLVLYNSRSARPGEVDGIDYHFRVREDIEKLRAKDRFVVMDVRGDLQALDLEELERNLGNSDVFFEGNPFVGRVLQTHPDLKGFNRLSIFMSPLSREELSFFKSVKPSVSLSGLVTDIMRRRLLRRTKKQKGNLSAADLENIEKRASSAWLELQEAYLYRYVIPNHDGEDSENWDAFYYPIGDARKSLLAFVDLLQGKQPDFAEIWEDRVL
ncbi:MAG TPA: hypothetical protein VE870_05145 [Bacteroidales bacterium]|nr:hypothetical protein [Bacteroidales bacterium]